MVKVFEWWTLKINLDRALCLQNFKLNIAYNRVFYHIVEFPGS